MSKITPYINIKPKNSNIKITPIIATAIGKLKDEINYDEIIDFMFKNKDFVDYINSTNYQFMPLPNYYNEEIAQYFDIFGNSYEVTVDDIEYTIKIYFYKIKQIELLTTEIILKFNLIFKYDYFVKNNVLEMMWHNYRFSTYFINNLNKQKFMDLSYQEPEYCLTKLFPHQKNNLARMINIHHNPLTVSISDNMPIYFENDLIFDLAKETFITRENIPSYNIFGGMIMDEPGTGKTLQFILYLLEMKLPSLILVPNDAIKLVWIEEWRKHINIKSNIPFDIMTFNELKEMLTIDENYLNDFQIIGIDEIHNLYKDIHRIFIKIISSSIKYRWGITGTGFVSDTSFFQIIKFLIGHKFNNERIVNSPKIQDKIMKLFLKNSKSDMLTCEGMEYHWPELTIHDVPIKLDIVQQNMYDTEKMINQNSYKLRRLVCEINLMFSEGEFNTPEQLKQFGISHYQKLYETEEQKLKDFRAQLQNIEDNKHMFKEEEYKHRIHHFNELIEAQRISTTKYQKASEFFMTAISNIDKVMKNDSDMDVDNEDECMICWDKYKMPITYIKSCGHYFCKSCIDTLMIHNNKCPKCRNQIIQSDVIHVQQMSDINNSPKIHELLNIIHTGGKFIIFTQFNQVIDKIKHYLGRNNITSETLGNYNDEQILLLSSQQNAEGINLTSFDKMIIFEPFEDNIYSSEVEKQLIARIHRIGRSKPVDVFRFITIGTIEEEIYRK